MKRRYLLVTKRRDKEEEEMIGECRNQEYGVNTANRLFKMYSVRYFKVYCLIQLGDEATDLEEVYKIESMCPHTRVQMVMRLVDGGIELRWMCENCGELINAVPQKITFQEVTL